MWWWLQCRRLSFDITRKFQRTAENWKEFRGIWTSLSKAFDCLLLNNWKVEHMCVHPKYSYAHKLLSFITNAKNKHLWTLQFVGKIFLCCTSKFSLRVYFFQHNCDHLTIFSLVKTSKTQVMGMIILFINLVKIVMTRLSFYNHQQTIYFNSF